MQMTAGMLAGVLFLLSASAAPAGVQARRAESYVESNVDADGRLRIVTANGRVILITKEAPSKEFEHVSFEEVTISPDRRAVAWTAGFKSVDDRFDGTLPLALGIYSNGRKRTLSGVGSPIWKWQFQRSGKVIAFEQSTFVSEIHFELHDVATGRRLAMYTDHPGAEPGGRVKAPQWATELDQTR